MYRLVVELREDLQEPDLVKTITSTLPGKWTFDHSGWGDDFTATMDAKLRDFDLQVETSVALIRRFAQASASGQVWKETYPGLDKELGAFLKKFDQTVLERVFPAAVLELRCTMRNLGNARMMFAEDASQGVDRLPDEEADEDDPFSGLHVRGDPEDVRRPDGGGANSALAGSRTSAGPEPVRADELLRAEATSRSGPLR
jgi:hypothetical protein